MLPRRDCVDTWPAALSASLDDWRDSGLAVPDTVRVWDGPGFPVPGALRNGKEALLLAGVPGVLSPPPPTVGLPNAWVESLDGTRDPPLPALLIAWPPTMLAEVDPGAGLGVADCLLFPTRRM
jgi:hypothetical protein